MYELTFTLDNGMKKSYDFDSLEEAKRVARNMCEFTGSIIAKTEIMEWEDTTDDDYGYSSNCHCDTYGFCGGTSCSQYWQCHSNN